ncbi:hypothetical protein LL912_19325 [Niabella sp. CC-SYL272]|uniref:hypothetical protein n=1 Tax=Niabella agricola TaxID=2891571 RepID=UPI001F20FF1F|nr:hypothetical protein [Niabella agricola]MCF3110946.1 hypothetical protein [Niabella agricola]
MRLFFYLSVLLLSLTQCKKTYTGQLQYSSDIKGPSGAAGATGACPGPNCTSVQFFVELTDKTTGANYITVNNITVTDIELRSASNQAISSNISVASPGNLKNVIIFPMPDRTRFYLKIKTMFLEVSYNSALNSSGIYEISQVKVTNHSSTFEKITGGYLLRISL